MRTGVGSGSNQFGNDGFYKFIRDGLCVVVSGSWDNGSNAGTWSANWSTGFLDSNWSVSARSCLYL